MHYDSANNVSIDGTCLSCLRLGTVVPVAIRGCVFLAFFLEGCASSSPSSELLPEFLAFFNVFCPCLDLLYAM